MAEFTLFPGTLAAEEACREACTGACGGVSDLIGVAETVVLEERPWSLGVCTGVDAVDGEGDAGAGVT